VRIQKVRTTCVLELSDRTAMVSIGFDEVTGWGGLKFTLQGVAPGEVHRITRSVIGRSDLYMLQDAPGGLFVVLAEAPLPSLAPEG
jgi:hypothetical protein